jgi:hypothetical protein
MSKHMDVATHILKDNIRVQRNMIKLPLEMLDQILAYEGRFRYRNGILMCQIPKNDPRKIVLSKIIPFNYDRITDRLSVELRINNYKYFRLSNTLTSTYVDMHLCTFFNCAQFDTLLAAELIKI